MTAAEIDRTNIGAATEMAMYEAIHGLDVMPDLLLRDARAVDIPIVQIAIIHGDAVSAADCVLVHNDAWPRSSR